MIEKTPSTHRIQRFYDVLGGRYDLFEFYESRAKERSLELLNLEAGLILLSVGVGTGKEQALIEEQIQPQGLAFGLDISPVMLSLAKSRIESPLCRGDVHHLPYATNSFDRLYAAYVLDLITLGEIPGILEEFYRVLKPEGQMVAISLTEGTNFPSRAIVGAWKLVYSVSPMICGGCRPLKLSDLVESAGFKLQSRDVIVQMGVPSEIILALR